jgi:ankyrin repeat protein
MIHRQGAKDFQTLGECSLSGPIWPIGRRYIRWLALPALTFASTVAVFAAGADRRLADAAEQHDLASVRTLLKAHTDVNGTQPDRTTALIWAAHWGDVEMVDLLLAAGADAKAANRLGSSALTEAADTANVPIMERLLKAGADANSVSQNNESALMSVCRAGSVEGAKLLLDHGADVNARDDKDEETPLMYAVFESHLPVVKLLISRGADVNAVAHTLDIPRRPNASNADFAARITGGFAVITFAARQDYVDIARALLDAGANPNVADRDGMTPLIVACLNGSFDVAALLLEKGADPNDGSLWEAVEFRNYIGTDENGRILMEPSTSKTDSLELIQLMLARGANPVKPYGKLRTLHHYNGTGRGALTNTSPLDHAIEAADADAVRLMLASAQERGIKFDPTPILAAEVRGYTSVGPGKMLFRTATPRDVEDMVTEAVNYGADVNAANAQGVTPLHLAAQQGADELVKLLVAKGAKFDVKTKSGMTPVDYALGKAGRLNGRRGFMMQEEIGPKVIVHESTVALLRRLMADPAGNGDPGKRQ